MSLSRLKSNHAIAWGYLLARATRVNSRAARSLRNKRALYFRRAALVVILGFLFSARPSIAEQPQKSAFDLMRKIVENQDQVTLEGVKIMAYWWDHQMSAQALHVYREPDAQRFDYFPANGHAYQEVIIKSPFVYHTNPSRHLAYRSSYENFGPKADTILALAEQNYSWIDEGEEKIAGRSTRRIAAVSKGDSEKAARFWVDPEHRAVIREERYDNEEKPTFFSGFLTVSFPKSLPNSLFELHHSEKLRDVPSPKELEGESVLKVLDFRPLLPRSLPNGFALVGTYLTEWGSHRKLQLRYSDGLRNFSVYENVRHGMYHPLRGSSLIHTKEGRSFELVEAPQGKLIRFGQGNLTLAVIGNIPLPMAQKIAENIGNDAPSTPIHRLLHYFHRGLSTLKRMSETSKKRE